MKLFDWFLPEGWSFLLLIFDEWGQQTINYLYTKYTKFFIKKKKKKMSYFFLFKTSRDLQPIVRFNIITGSKGDGLFPILSGLIEPSLRNFRISLSNGLFSPVGIGKSIPSLRTVLESFLPHTARQSILLVSPFISSSISNKTRFLIDLSGLGGLTKRG